MKELAEWLTDEGWEPGDYVKPPNAFTIVWLPEDLNDPRYGKEVPVSLEFYNAMDEAYKEKMEEAMRYFDADPNGFPERHMV
jgi:hypothetical protein